MRQVSDTKNGRTFTIELESKEDLNIISVEQNKKVLIEGSIGSLKRARFLEGLVLEVMGSNGELRMDLAMGELQGSIAPEGKADEGRNGQ